MAKEKIPVYDICKLQGNGSMQDDFLAERLTPYLEKHYHQLHFPHRHSFYHIVLFTAGKGTHSIDFLTYPVAPFQLYCMIPGQVHSWHFTGQTNGYVINFSDRFFNSFLLNPHYLERFSFFSGSSSEGVIKIPANARAAIVELLEAVVLAAATSRALHDADKLKILLLHLFLLIEEETPKLSEKPCRSKRPCCCETSKN